MKSDALVSLVPAQIYTVYVIAAVAIIATFLCSIPRASAICASVSARLLGSFTQPL
jgi:hypothetical protein